MAKLSARGRTELQRWERTLEGDAITPSLRDIGIVKERFVRTLMSDRSILQKVSTTWKPGGLVYGPDVNHGPWKLLGKLKAETTPEAYADILAKRWTRI